MSIQLKLPLMADEWGGIEYLMYYPCCFVSGMALRKQICWACEDVEALGVDLHRAKDILPPHQWPVREGGSRAYLQMSTVKLEVTKWRHP